MNYKSIIESLLYIWGEPLSYKEIAKIIEKTPRDTKKILNEMMLDCDSSDRGLELKQYGDNFQYVTKEANLDYVKKLVNKNENKNITNSSMEVLSIIAYKQPITRIEIEEIRGVRSQGPIDTLLSRDLIMEVGRLEQLISYLYIFQCSPIYKSSFLVKRSLQFLNHPAEVMVLN